MAKFPPSCWLSILTSIRPKPRGVLQVETLGKPSAVVLDDEGHVLLCLGKGNFYPPGLAVDESVFHCVGQQFIEDDPQGEEPLGIQGKIIDALDDVDRGLPGENGDDLLDKVVQVVFTAMSLYPSLSSSLS